MYFTNKLYSTFLLLILISGAFLLIQCSSGSTDNEKAQETIAKSKVQTATSTSEKQELENELFIVVSGEDYKQRKLDLSISVMSTGWTYMNSSDINQAKVIGGYAEGSDFGTATLTLLFPGTSSGKYEFIGRGDFLRGNPGLSLSPVEILGLPQMHASKGTIMIDSYPAEKGDWLTGSFDATFKDDASGIEYQIEGEFAVER